MVAPLDVPEAGCDDAAVVEATEVRVPMTETRRTHLVLLARLLSTFTVLSVLVGLWLSTMDQGETDLGLLLAFGLFPIVGYFMATRRPDNALSWIMVGLGVAIGVGAVLSSYAGYALNGGIGGRQLGLIAEAFDNPMWIPVVVPPVTFMLLLFPDGHLPSPRWKWFARILGASMAIVYLTILLAPGKFGDEAGPVRGLPEPARRGGAPPGALGRDRQPRHASDRGRSVHSWPWCAGSGAPRGSSGSSCGCW